MGTMSRSTSGSFWVISFRSWDRDKGPLSTQMRSASVCILGGQRAPRRACLVSDRVQNYPLPLVLGTSPCPRPQCIPGGLPSLDGPWGESPRYLAACPQSPLPVALGSPDTPTPCCLLPPPLGAPPGEVCPAAPTTQMVCGWVELGGAGRSTWKDAVRVNRTALELASLPNPPALLPTLSPAGAILQSSSQ